MKSRYANYALVNMKQKEEAKIQINRNHQKSCLMIGVDLIVPAILFNN